MHGNSGQHDLAVRHQNLVAVPNNQAPGMEQRRISAGEARWCLARVWLGIVTSTTHASAEAEHLHQTIFHSAAHRPNRCLHRTKRCNPNSPCAYNLHSHGLPTVYGTLNSTTPPLLLLSICPTNALTLLGTRRSVGRSQTYRHRQKGWICAGSKAQKSRALKEIQIQ